MKKKGQVTIFIIIALAIVAAGGLYFAFKDSVSKEKSDIPVEITPIKNFVDECIESEIEKTVYLIGEGGGYYFPPVLSNSDGYTYYFYEGENYFPSLKEIEGQLSSSISLGIGICVDNFEDFSDYEIVKKIVSIDTEILDERIIFDIRFPLKISKGDSNYILRDFGEHKFYVKLGTIHKGIDNLIKEDYYSEEGICLDCFSEMMLEGDLRIDIIEGGVGNFIFIIGDYNKDYNRSFNYIFAV